MNGSHLPNTNVKHNHMLITKLNAEIKKIRQGHTCGKLKAVLLSPIIAKESRIWLTWCNYKDHAFFPEEYMFYFFFS